MDWFYSEKFEPRFKPREYVQIAGEFYEIVETRPMFRWDLKLTNLTSIVEYSLKDQGLKGIENELLNYRLKIHGPVKILIRIEGSGGPLVGGYGAYEKPSDETTPSEHLEFLTLADKYGWLYIKIMPLTTPHMPGWCRLTAYFQFYKRSSNTGRGEEGGGACPFQFYKRSS